MVRYSAVLLAILHVVSSQVPTTCSTCNRDKAALIGKVTCDKEGRLTTECSKGVIQMKVAGKYYAFNRVTCIEGEWFGTSCSGIALYLSSVLPDSTCPDIDFPEVQIPGSNCSVRPIGLPDVYDQHFAALPKLLDLEGFEGYYGCTDQEQWQNFFRFRHTASDIYGELHGKLYIRQDDGIVGTGLVKCLLNPSSGKYELSGGGVVFYATNQIECLYKKCPPFLSYNKVNGRCEPDDANACGYALVYSKWDELMNSYPLPRESTTNIPANCTHLITFPGCKISVYGSKLFANSDKKIPIVFEQSFGQSTIYSFKYDANAAAFNLPNSVVCENDGTSKTAPVLMTDLETHDYKVSHESRYFSIAIEERASFILTQFNKALEPGLSFSLSGSGSGILNVYLGSAWNFLVSLDFTTKKLSYNFTQVTPTVTGERNLLISSPTFHVRFVIAELDFLEVYTDGRLAFRFSDARLNFRAFLINRTNVVVDKCDFFVPKRCGKGHKFSAKTGDCEWDSPSKHCAIITDVRTGMDARSESFIQSNTIPEDFKYKSSFIEVRQGCIAYAYDGLDKKPQWLNENSVLNHGRYNFPSIQSGTCSQLEKGLKNIECYCDNYNKNPVHNSEVFDADNLIGYDMGYITVGDNFVFTAQLGVTTPMAQMALLASDGSLPLVLFMGDGKLIADNKPKGGCFENYQVMADAFPVKPGDFFECRIRMLFEGFEVYVNGVRVMEYPYRNGFDDFGNYYKIDKARFFNGLYLRNYRSDRENNGMGQFHNSLWFDEPFRFGDYVHVNGLATAPFNLSLCFYDNDDPLAGPKPLFTVEADAQHKITQHLTTKNGKKSLTSTASLVAGVEFDIVLVNKPHSIEVYVNGVILPVIGENIQNPETTYTSVSILESIIRPTIFDMRRGPKKIEGSPVWSG